MVEPYDRDKGLLMLYKYDGKAKAFIENSQVVESLSQRVMHWGKDFFLS